MTFLESRQRVAELLGLPQDDTSFDDKFKEWINNRYRVLCGKRSWNWLIKDSVIQTVTQITTGTVNVTNNSTSFTFSSAPSVSVANWFIQFGDTENWYEISSHTASQTAAALSNTFIGTTNTAATYKLRKVYYLLPSDTGKVLDMRETVSDRKITYVPIRQLDRYVPDRTQTGDPDFYSIVGMNSSKLFRVEFHPVPSQALNVSVRYYQVASEMSLDADTPLIPEPFHDILVWDALATYGYMFLDDSRIAAARKIRDEIYADMVKNDIDAENIAYRTPFDVDMGELTRDEWLRHLDLPIS